MITEMTKDKAQSEARYILKTIGGFGGNLPCDKDIALEFLARFTERIFAQGVVYGMEKARVMQKKLLAESKNVS